MARSGCSGTLGKSISREFALRAVVAIDGKQPIGFHPQILAQEFKSFEGLGAGGVILSADSHSQTSDSYLKLLKLKIKWPVGRDSNPRPLQH
jgi:hypothetical protein